MSASVAPATCAGSVPVGPLDTMFPVWGILLVVIGGGGVLVLAIWLLVRCSRRGYTPTKAQEYATLVDDNATASRYT